MVLEEILGKCKELPIQEKRFVSDEYQELVISSKDLDKWYQFFTDILGPAAKPEGAEPNKDDINLTQPYGGIFENQTLFKKEVDNTMVIAMFWPWQNRLNTTLKLVLLEKK